MAEIIYSNMQDTINYAKAYDNIIYAAGAHGIYVIESKVKKKVVECQDTDGVCLGSIVENDKLYYAFSKKVYIIHKNIISSVEVDLRNAEAVTIKDERFYYWKFGCLIPCDLSGENEIRIDIKNAVRPQKIEFINEKYIILGDAKGRLWLANLTNKAVKLFKLHSDAIQDILVEGTFIITVSRDRKVRSSHFDEAKMNICQMNVSDEFRHFINCIQKVYEYYFIGLSDGTISCIDVNLNIIYTQKIHKDSIRMIQKISANRWISFADDGVISIFHIRDNRIKVEERRGDYSDTIQCVCAIENKLYMGCCSGKIHEVDICSGSDKIICTVANVRSICNIDSNILVCGCENGYLYSIFINEQSSKIIGRKGTTPYSIMYKQETQLLFVGRRNGTIDCYKVVKKLEVSLKQKYTSKPHLSVVGDIIEDGGVLYTCSDDQSIKMLDYKLNILSSMMSTSHNTAINNILLTKEYILASSDNGYIYKIDRENPDNKKMFSMFDMPVRALTLSDSEMLYIGDRDGNVFVWDMDAFATSLYKGNTRVVKIIEIKKQIYVVFEDSIVKLDLEVEKMKKREKVFIIHGHSNELKREVQLLLERIGIEGIVLHEKADKGRTVIDKLIEEAETAVYAIAILTPDDIVDSAFRARQNVYLETGYFLGKIGKSKVLLLKAGNIEIPSDLQGILYTEVDNISNGYWKSKVVKELVEVGFNVDMSRLIKII